jgi:hypothetical protein
LSPRSHDVHPAAKKGFEFHLHPAKVHQRPSGLELYEKIYIALPIGLPAGYGPEDPHLTRSVIGCDAQDLFALVLQKSVKLHAPTP